MAIALLAACGTTALEPLPLQITTQASRVTAAPGDTIAFVATVQGENLLGLTADYGDNTGDSYGVAGARTAKVTFRHAYTSRGTFTATITITDALAGQKHTSIDIRVN
jgi:hypothetical protein